MRQEKVNLGKILLVGEIICTEYGEKSVVEFCGEILVNRLNIYNAERRRNGI